MYHMQQHNTLRKAVMMTFYESGIHSLWWLMVMNLCHEANSLIMHAVSVWGNGFSRDDEEEGIGFVYKSIAYHSQSGWAEKNISYF